MHYNSTGSKDDKLDGVDKFLKTMGKNSIVPQDKLVVKENALPKEGAMEIVVLNP